MKVEIIFLNFTDNQIAEASAVFLRNADCYSFWKSRRVNSLEDTCIHRNHAGRSLCEDGMHAFSLEALSLELFLN